MVPVTEDLAVFCGILPRFVSGFSCFMDTSVQVTIYDSQRLLKVRRIVEAIRAV